MKKSGVLFSLVTKTEILLSVITFVLSALVVISLFMFAQYFDIEFGFITKDTAAIFEAPGFYGFMSNLGISFWGISAMSFLMAWYHIKNNNYEARMVKLSLSFGLLSALLYVDDFFMIHDYFIIRIFRLPGSILMVFYGVCVMYLVLRHFNVFKANGLLYIVGSFGFLGLSAVVDTLHDKFEFKNAYLFEDGSKFLGICFWMLFALSFSLKLLKGRSKKENTEV